MKTVFYWSPCLSKVGTVKSTLNSALALSKYTKEESWWLAIGLYAKNRIKEYQNV